MRILITGSLGHIGSALYPELAKDHQITVIDNLSTQRYVSLLHSPSPIKFIEGDILSLNLDSLFADQDVVIHLAAITDAAGTANDPSRVWGVNYYGTQKVARACLKNGCHLIFPSTTSVYGKSDSTVDEDCPSLQPQSPYAESKLAAEQYIKDTLVNYTILRLGTIFGLSVGYRVHTAINSFVWSAIVRKPIKVWSTAWEQVRPYLHLYDAITAMQHVIDNRLFGTYNVVSENSTPKHIVECIQEHREVETTFTESPIMNQLSYDVSSEKLIKTGWSPEISIQDGISQYFQLLGNVNEQA